MTTAALANQQPDVIESQIETTRASLDRKLAELERRLDPRRQARSLRNGLEARAPQLFAWSAFAAVAAGAAMAVSGWRRIRERAEDEMFLCECIADELAG